MKKLNKSLLLLLCNLEEDVPIDWPCQYIYNQLQHIFFHIYLHFRHLQLGHQGYNGEQGHLKCMTYPGEESTSGFTSPFHLNWRLRMWLSSSFFKYNGKHKQLNKIPS